MAVSIETVQRSPRSQGCSPRRDVRARSAAALRVARGVQVQKVHARAGHLCRSGRADGRRLAHRLRDDQLVRFEVEHVAGWRG